MQSALQPDRFVAWSRASNKEVVLKVLKPGVEDIMKSDLSFVYLTMKILQYLNPALQRASLVDIVGAT